LERVAIFTFIGYIAFNVYTTEPTTQVVEPQPAPVTIPQDSPTPNPKYYDCIEGFTEYYTSIGQMNMDDKVLEACGQVYPKTL